MRGVRHLICLLTALTTAAAPLLAAAQMPLTLELLAPRDEPAVTTREFVNVLGRTAPGAQVRVGGEPVTVYATGVFARDRVALVPGPYRIRIAAVGVGGQTLERTLDIERQAPAAPAQWPSDRLWLDGSSLRPAALHRVAPGEGVEVAVRATPGQRVEARLPGQRWWPLVEAEAGRYRALIAFVGSDDVQPAAVQVRVTPVALPRSAGKRPLNALTPGEAGQWRADPERLFAVGAEGADLLHGLHEVRLGGPFLAELPAGVLLAATGQRGEWLRVALSPGVDAWVASSAVTPAPPGTLPPQLSFTSISISGSAEGDVVQVPLGARVPYAVAAVSDSAGRHSLQVDIFGAHHATTWISQRATAKVVREVTAEQIGPARVRLTIALQQPRLWGWRTERTAGALRVVLRAAPAVVAEGSQLAGIHIALEPGHGSASNLGAVGATGTPEKDINRWTVDALKAELEAAGARVSVVREGDENPSPRERARRVTASGAQVFVSVHANSTDTGGGYLRVSGTSTFHKHGSGRDLAAALHRRMLEQTGLEDFGLVSNFNYTPMRLSTWMPAALVEQAFVSHPGDEARLLDPAFRALMARAVRQGLEDFLRLPR